MVKELYILKSLDNETVLQLIDAAYEYMNGSPLPKLTINVRAPFSAIYRCLKHAGPKMYGELLEMSLDKEIKTELMLKMSNIYSENATRVGLLTTYHLDCKEKRIVDSSKKAESAVEGVTINPIFLSCQWKINIVLSHSKLHRVLIPEIVLELATEDGKTKKIVMTTQQFEEMRRQVAYLLRSTQQLECLRYLNKH